MVRKFLREREEDEIVGESNLYLTMTAPVHLLSPSYCHTLSGIRSVGSS